MSNFQQATRHPETGVEEVADWLDDYFGRHRYGVRFADGKVFRETEIGTAVSSSGESIRDDYPTREDLLANIRGNPHLTQTQQRAAVAALTGSGGVPPGLGGPPAQHPPSEPKTFYERGVT